MPAEKKVTRKLRAILSADVKGYSLLMADDEAFTVKTLKSYRKVMSAQIVRHKGRVVDAPGDNLLSEFASVVDAVQCAVEVQKILKENIWHLMRFTELRISAVWISNSVPTTSLRTQHYIFNWPEFYNTRTG